MRIYYGITNNSIEITSICIEKLTNNNIITIPHGDINRSYYFTDPLHGIKKQIIIEHNDIMTEYDEFQQIKINMSNNTVSTFTNTTNSLINETINNKIKDIHSTLKINYGSLNGELPEQKMAIRYLTGKEKVLEIGGNIGRNSLVIARILDDCKNLLTIECDEVIAKQLTENRDLNNLNFNIENSALSNRKLIQSGWNTEPSETLKYGFQWVKTITLEDLKNKYGIVFDTLVLDCEGAFYYILMDMPEILNNINLIIMENDYYDKSHKIYIDTVLTKNNFYRDYVEKLGSYTLYDDDNFFEVWKKI